jgi:hypothetical protein
MKGDYLIVADSVALPDVNGRECYLTAGDVLCVVASQSAKSDTWLCVFRGDALCPLFLAVVPGEFLRMLRWVSPIPDGTQWKAATECLAQSMEQVFMGGESCQMTH